MGAVRIFALLWRVLTAPLAPAGRTSITDNGWFSDYYAALASGPRFARFRRDPVHLVIVEPTPRADARRHLARALASRPDYAPLLARLGPGDAVGTPLTASFPPHGRFAPDTLRYLRYLSDNETRFGRLDGETVVEIGVGYGGACRLFLERFELERYFLVDLPGPLAMARRFLDETLGADRVARRVSFVPAPPRGERPRGLPERPGLALSTMAFSECARPVQEAYLDSVLRPAARGYLHHNELAASFGVDALSLAELMARLPGPVSIEDGDLSLWDDRERILSWKAP